MSVDTFDPNDLVAYVQRVNAAWRQTERNMTWEEKIAAIERMWERDKGPREAREQNDLAAVERKRN